MTTNFRKHTTPFFLLAVLAGACSNANDPSSAGSDDPSWVNPAASDDRDADGLPNDRDLCPGTANGAAVDGSGCSDGQRQDPGDDGAAGTSSGTSSTPESGSIGTWTPSDDGSVGANGFATFVLDPNGAYPVVLRTLKKNVTTRENGFDLDGTVLVDVPGGEPLTLLEAKVALDRGDGGGLESFSGSVRLPFPNIGFAKDVNVHDPVYAAAGYDFGRNHPEVDVPLDDDRKYFYFTFSAGLEADIGDLEVSCGEGESATMALDPSDPAFFLRASLGGLLGPVDEASIGVSIGGHLEFEPENTWGIDEQAAGFEGHFWIGGTVDLNAVRLPLAVTGNTVYDFDPNDDGKSLFEEPEDGFQFGSNSALDMSIDAKLVSFSIPIAGATVVGRVGASAGSAWYSGVIRAGNGWMPEDVPLKNTGALKIAGFASSSPEESYFHAEGEAKLDAGKLGEWTGLDLEDLAVANASLDADKDGVLVRGTVNARFSPYVGLAGDVDAEGFFDGDPDDWYLSLDGRLEVGGVDLSADAHALLDEHGMFVEGVMATPLSNVDMSGTITREGVDLRGHAEVRIPIVAGKVELQWVTDQVVCGTELVTDEALCGTRTVKDAVLCGSDYLTSGADCGVDMVRDAGVCGTTFAQNGAECGWDYVTSGAQCGWDHFSDVIHCGTSCLTGHCDCSFERSCNVGRSCTFPSTCPVERSCDVPRSCPVAATCPQAATCQTRVIVPEFDYGTFRGTVDLEIGTHGLAGSVAGEYCPTGGSCVTLAGGRVVLGSGGPQACVTVGTLGEFCEQF